MRLPPSSRRLSGRPHASRAVRRASAAVAVTAVLTAGSVLPAMSASASTAAPAAVAARGITPGARFFIPPPSTGAPQQVISLLKAHDLKDAALITKMETIPRAVWFTSGTPAQVKQQVQ